MNALLFYGLLLVFSGMLIFFVKDRKPFLYKMLMIAIWIAAMFAHFPSEQEHLFFYVIVPVSDAIILGLAIAGFILSLKEKNKLGIITLLMGIGCCAYTIIGIYIQKNQAIDNFQNLIDVIGAAIIACTIFTKNSLIKENQ